MPTANSIYVRKIVTNARVSTRKYRVSYSTSLYFKVIQLTLDISNFSIAYT
jgi:hypothetical protein